jgi:ankyrin repeat protein
MLSSLSLEDICLLCARGDVDGVRRAVQDARCQIFLSLTDAAGLSPLHHASLHGHLDVVNVLLLRNVDTAVRSREGLTASQIALSSGHTAVSERIDQWHDLDDDGREFEFDHQANLSLEREMLAFPKRFSRGVGDGPIHWAAREGRASLADHIATRHSLEVNRLNDMGMTPLHVAAVTGSMEVVVVLTKRHDADTKKLVYLPNKLIPSRKIMAAFSCNDQPEAMFCHY